MLKLTNMDQYKEIMEANLEKWGKGWQRLLLGVLQPSQAAVVEKGVGMKEHRPRLIVKEQKEKSVSNRACAFIIDFINKYITKHNIYNPKETLSRVVIF